MDGHSQHGTQSAVVQAVHAQPAAISAVALTKRFGERVVVDQLSFQVQRGELYALLGDNGAGKTTTINMLTTLLEPSGGEFFICGANGVKNPEAAKANFGVVSQEVALYGELTAYENLKFIADLYGIPRSVRDERIIDLLQRIGLADRAHDQAGEFSTGMQRRLSIAISMLHHPRVIFMDEPTVGLDPASRRQIWEQLMELKRSGVTVVLTTHYLDEAEMLADRIGIIRRGKMVMEGTIDELRTQIRAVQTVTVELRESADLEQIGEILHEFKASHSGMAQIDRFHHRIVFTPPGEIDLTCYLETVIAWLKAKNIPFNKFATTAPSLEDIFLSVEQGGRVS